MAKHSEDYEKLLAMANWPNKKKNREEIISELNEMLEYQISGGAGYDSWGEEFSLIMVQAIELLEQPTTKDCLAVGDCVSRTAVIEHLVANLTWYDNDNEESNIRTVITELVNEIPPVTPTQCIATVQFSKEELRDICNERIEVACQHGTCKDCKHLKVWRSGRRKGIYCGLHTEADFCFEVEKDFYCAYFEKKGTCKDCRAWRPRGGENGFCARSPHGCKADESCENFEKRGAENG